MTVGELIEELQCYDEDIEVGFMGANSGGYIDSAESVTTTEVNCFYSDPTEMVVIYGTQIGHRR